MAAQQHIVNIAFCGMVETHCLVHESIEDTLYQPQEKTLRSRAFSHKGCCKSKQLCSWKAGSDAQTYTSLRDKLHNVAKLKANNHGTFWAYVKRNKSSVPCSVSHGVTCQSWMVKLLTSTQKLVCLMMCMYIDMKHGRVNTLQIYCQNRRHDISASLFWWIVTTVCIHTATKIRRPAHCLSDGSTQCSQGLVRCQGSEVQQAKQQCCSDRCKQHDRGTSHPKQLADLLYYWCMTLHCYWRHQNQCIDTVINRANTVVREQVVMW